MAKTALCWYYCNARAALPTMNFPKRGSLLLPTGLKQPLIIEGKSKTGSDSALLRPGDLHRDTIDQYIGLFLYRRGQCIGLEIQVGGVLKTRNTPNKGDNLFNKLSG